MVLTPLVSVLSTHDVEVAETLIGVINFLDLCCGKDFGGNTCKA